MTAIRKCHPRWTCFVATAFWLLSLSGCGQASHEDANTKSTQPARTEVGARATEQDLKSSSDDVLAAFAQAISGFKAQTSVELIRLFPSPFRASPDLRSFASTVLSQGGTQLQSKLSKIVFANSHDQDCSQTRSLEVCLPLDFFRRFSKEELVYMVPSFIFTAIARADKPSETVATEFELLAKKFFYYHVANAASTVTRNRAEQALSQLRLTIEGNLVFGPVIWPEMAVRDLTDFLLHSRGAIGATAFTGQRTNKIAGDYFAVAQGVLAELEKPLRETKARRTNPEQQAVNNVLFELIDATIWNWLAFFEPTDQPAICVQRVSRLDPKLLTKKETAAQLLQFKCGPKPDAKTLVLTNRLPEEELRSREEWRKKIKAKIKAGDIWYPSTFP